MIRALTSRQPPAKPRHPGAVLRDEAMPAARLSRAELARMLEISGPHLRAILMETKSITPELAARLGKLFGNGPGHWIRLQSDHDEWSAIHDVDVSTTPSLSVILPASSASQANVPFALRPRPIPFRYLLLITASVAGVIGAIIGAAFVAIIPVIFVSACLAAAGIAYLRHRVRRDRY